MRRGGCEVSWRRAGVSAAGLVDDAERRTTTKVRVVTSAQPAGRAHRLRDRRDGAAAIEASGDRSDRIAARSERLRVHRVSDYLKGVVTRRLMAQPGGLRASARGIPLLVDPEDPAPGFYARRHAGHAEPSSRRRSRRTCASARDDDARRAARLFRERAGSGGRADHARRARHVAGRTAASKARLPATAREVSDVTGAGDTVIATLALALAAGATAAEAAALANHAAGIVVGKFGPATVSAEELLGRFA